MLLWAWVMFGLILGGMPRWQTHHHVLTDHDHPHALAMDEHHAVALNDLEADAAGDDAAVTHLHALMPLPLATQNLDLLTTVLAVAERPVFPTPLASTAMRRWPPPHRPPIA